MYKTILVPLDGSKRAEAILPHVEKLASLFQARVIFLRVFELLHFIDLPRAGDEPYHALPHFTVEEMEEQVGRARAYLNGRVEEMRAKGITAGQRVEFGPVVATILNVAAREGADLIAMASHGSSGLEGVYYGSVAAGVLQRVDRPLLIVRADNSSP